MHFLSQCHDKSFGRSFNFEQPRVTYVNFHRNALTKIKYTSTTTPLCCRLIKAQYILIFPPLSKLYNCLNSVSVIHEGR
jgi:hypothetical protein